MSGRDLIRHEEGGHLHWCPGCRYLHVIPEGKGWTFNGDLDSPSFEPSIKHSTVYHDPSRKATICHYFIRSGAVQFCGDCTHDLAGQTVPLTSIADALAAREKEEIAIKHLTREAAEQRALTVWREGQGRIKQAFYLGPVFFPESGGQS